MAFTTTQVVGTIDQIKTVLTARIAIGLITNIVATPLNSTQSELGAASISAGNISGNTLTITTIPTGAVTIGSILSGGGVAAGTTITAFVSGTGGAGTYLVNIAQTVASIAGATTANTPDAGTVVCFITDNGAGAGGQTAFGFSGNPGSVVTVLNQVAAAAAVGVICEMEALAFNYVVAIGVFK